VELLTMIPLLKDLARDDVEDVRDVLCSSFEEPWEKEVSQ